MRQIFGAALVWCCALFAAAVEPEPTLTDGTLLFLENCNSVVEWSTRGEIAHAAIVFHEAGEAWVYEATPAKVRRVKLAEYRMELERLNKSRKERSRVKVLALGPKPEYTGEETARMRKYLEEQVGRRYSVKNYVRGRPYDGIHCAELAASTLNRSGRYAFADCYNFNPQRLYKTVAATHFGPVEVAIDLPTESEKWTARARRRTSGWFSWCGWSCREAWLFLW